MAPPVAPEILLAHSAWMRRLARTLVRDDARADDVVQDALVSALRAPPRDPVALPAWLATAVRNGAKQIWRGESRRTARETAAARPEAQPAAGEVVARAEEHGLVVQAVLALDEPHRSALLLRFFDDLPPREIAKRLGVPVETARARVRRGVEELRRRLDAAHGGDGAGWKLALVPLAGVPDLVPASGAAATSGSGAPAGAGVLKGAMTMAAGSTVVAACAALAVGAGAGWWLASSGAQPVLDQRAKEVEAANASLAKLTEDLRAATAASDSSTKELRSISASLQKAAADMKALTEQYDALKAQYDALAAAYEKLAKRPATAPKGPRFTFDEYDKLASVDWRTVGEHLSAMAPLCAEVAEASLTGADAKPALGKVVQHNGFLVNAVLKVSDQVPGTGPNGAFTHPAFQANAIAAALEAAGKALTVGQEAAIEKLAREASAEDVRRLQSYDESTFTVKKLIEEADLRRRFYEAAFAALTEEQRLTLTPASTKGRLGLDLYSEGLLWATVLRPVPFKDAAGLADAATSMLSRVLKVPEESKPVVAAAVAAWRDAQPASVISPTEEAAKRGATAADVAAAARLTLSLLERVVADLHLEGAAAAPARRFGGVIYPAKDNDD